jgi:hypothetical protein
MSLQGLFCILSLKPKSNGEVVVPSSQKFTTKALRKSYLLP